MIVSVTAAAASKATALTVFGAADHRPAVPTLLAAKGQRVAGWTVVPLSSRGAIKVFNRAGTVGVHLAVQGWFGKVTPPAGQPAGPDPDTLAGLTAGAGSPSVLAEPPVTGRDVDFGVDDWVYRENDRAGRRFAHRPVPGTAALRLLHHADADHSGRGAGIRHADHGTRDHRRAGCERDRRNRLRPAARADRSGADETRHAHRRAARRGVAARGDRCRGIR